MCRNIRPLFNFEPPATDEEVRAAALQYVRKVSGTRAPSGKNVAVFDRAVLDIERATRRLVDTLSTVAAPKSREVEAARARERNVRRFGGRSEARSDGSERGALTAADLRDTSESKIRERT